MGVPYSEGCSDDVEIAAEVDWSNISNVPSYITTDWSVDQGDTNIDANNIPLLSYAPNTLASNGTPGLSNFNFNTTRKQKLDSIENGAQVNVQANWDEADNTSDSYIHSKPTLFSGSYSDLLNRPSVTTTTSMTSVGFNVGQNAEGNLTAFGRGAGNTANNGHICIGELSGNRGSSGAISIGYNTHATHPGSVVIHGKDLDGFSSSATDAFYIDPLRTLNALDETPGDMKINMYNTSTKEIFLTDNLFVPGNTKLNGTLEVSNGVGSGTQVLTSNGTTLTWKNGTQTFLIENNAVNPLDTSQVGSLSFGSGANANTLIYTPATPVITVTTHLAPLVSPALTGTPTVNGQVIKVNTGDGALTDKNFTAELQTKLAGIADNADVTPSWVPPSDPGYQTVSDVTAAISGKQDTLSNGVGVSIQNNSVNIAQDVGPSSNVQFGGLTLSGGISSAGMLQIYDAFPATNAPVFTVNNLTGNVYAAPDQNTSHEFGKMKIGYIGLSDIAAMSHYDMANSTDYAVLQSQLGGTVVNAKLGQKVSIYNNGSDLTAEFFNTGINLRKDTTVYGNLTLESVSSQIQTITASKIATWDALAASSTPGDLGDVKIRGDRNFIGDGYTYTVAHGIRAFHFHLNNGNFANPLPSNATMSIIDYYGVRIGARPGVIINFPHNHVYFHYGYSQASDDRLKHNETPITDGLSVINQLSVLRYDRAKDFTSREDMQIEVGMIAQEVQTIPQLSHCVAEPMYEEDNYKMVYQDIHNYHIAATQELYKLVLDLQARIAVLESR